MSVLAKILGGGAAKPIDAIGNVLDKVFTSKEEKMNMDQLMERLKQRPAELQVEINKVEAQHRTIFVAGWRPFIGWVCGMALAYNYIFRDLIAWVVLNWFDTVSLPPNLAMEHLITILGGMLGFGILRTVEKSKGVAH